MKDGKNCLTPNENIIRRMWAILTAVQTVSILMLYVQNIPMYEIAAKSIGIAIASSLPLLLMQYLIFHFIFIKHGTKLLRVLLFWMPISCVYSFVFGYQAGLMSYQMIGSWVLTSVWYVLLWKMLTINNRIKAQLV